MLELTAHENIGILKKHIIPPQTFAAASSQITVTSGWNCRMEPGTSGLTDPKKT